MDGVFFRVSDKGKREAETNENGLNYRKKFELEFPPEANYNSPSSG
jgi:hypothetical protein